MIKHQPRFIQNEIVINIRFSEVDAMRIVWHGNYLKFFEDGRESLGNEYNLDYLKIANNGILVPIVKSEIEHLGMVEYGHKVKVVTRLVDSPAAKIIHEYEVINLNTGQIAARGKTVQAFITADRELLITIPEFYTKWKTETNWIEIE